MPASVEIFKKYPNPVFVETGSCHGDGIQQAIDAGFREIYSMEQLKEYYNICINRFQDIKYVHLLHGDSNFDLDEILQMINQPATFWLDAHRHGGELTKYSCPLMQELEMIKNHPIKTHTILIDDLRDWRKDIYGFDAEDLKLKILEINENYKFCYEDGCIPNDILVAYSET